MRAILFLDFDGVLHPASAYETKAFCHAPALADYLRPHPCDVVISSSWRFNYSLDELKNHLPASLAARVIGTTGPAHIGRHARFHEIREFFQRNGDLATRSWRALDDALWEFPPRHPSLIVCDPNAGLADPELRQLGKWLTHCR